MVELLKVKYKGKALETGEEFEAKDILLVLGKNILIPGLEEALKEMKEGESKVVKIPPEKGYGERKADLIKIVSLQSFRKNNIEPYPGMEIEVDGVIAKVQSVSGGRVRLDFNPKFAGKTLEYDITLLKKYSKLEDQILAIYEKTFPDVEEKPEIKETGGEYLIELPEKCLQLPEYASAKIEFQRAIKELLGISAKVEEKRKVMTEGNKV
ncbi:MAG: peptidylprolyl isomerase [archaeon]